MKNTPRISGKPFDLESPNFTGHSYRNCLWPYRKWRHYLLPVGSWMEKQSKTASNGFWWISRETFKLGSRNCTIVFWTILSRTSGPTNLLEIASPAPSGRLQNAIKYCRKVRKTGPIYRERLLHSLMLFLRGECGLLMRWPPSTVPNRIFGSISCRKIWQSYDNLRRFSVDVDNKKSWRLTRTFICRHIQSFVLCSWYETPSILL